MDFGVPFSKLMGRIDALSQRSIFWMIVGFWSCFYALMVAWYPTGFGDSDELIVNGYLLGFVHPPGYPLSNVLVWVFTHFIPFGTVAFRANLLADLLASINLGFVYLIGCHLLIKAKLTEVSKARWLVGIVVVQLALSPVFWTYALVYEVFGLHILFVLVSIYLALILAFAQKQHIPYLDRVRLLDCLAVLVGLGLAHQQLYLLIVPGLILMVYKPNKQFDWLSSVVILRWLALMLLGFGLSYLPLFMFNPQTPLSWTGVDSIGGFWHYLTRADYAQGESSLSAYFGNFYLPDNMRSLWLYITQALPRGMGWGLLLFSGIGLKMGLKQFPTPVRLGLGFIIFMLTFGLGFYLHMPDALKDETDYWFLIGVIERIYLTGFVGLSLVAPLGLATVLDWCQSRWAYRHGATGLIVGIVGFMVWMGVAQYPDVRLSEYQAVDQYATQVLSNLPPNSLILCFSDISCFSLIHTQIEKQQYREIPIVPITKPLHATIKNKFPEYFMPDYPDAYMQMGAVVSKALHQHKRVFAAQLPMQFVSQIGIKEQVFNLRPAGLVTEIGCELPQPQKGDYALGPSSKLAFKRAFRQMLGQESVLHAQLSQFNSSECILAEQIASQADHCSLQNDLSCEYKYRYWASLRNPYEFSIRKQLADVYLKAGMKEMADKELNWGQNMSN